MPDDMTHEIAERWVARSIDSWKQDTPRFAITESPTDAALGQVGMAFSWDERRAEVFYWLAEEARGRGLASGAVNLVAEWAFSEFDIRRLQLVTEPGNHASESVASRCGFVNEGLLRAWQEVKGKQPDVHMWSRVRNGDPPNSI